MRIRFNDCFLKIFHRFHCKDAKQEPIERVNRPLSSLRLDDLRLRSPAPDSWSSPPGLLLPNEVLLRVLSFCDDGDLGRIRLTCSLFDKVRMYAENRPVREVFDLLDIFNWLLYVFQRLYKQ